MCFFLLPRQQNNSLDSDENPGHSYIYSYITLPFLTARRLQRKGKESRKVDTQFQSLITIQIRRNQQYLNTSKTFLVWCKWNLLIVLASKQRKGQQNRRWQQKYLKFSNNSSKTWVFLALLIQQSYILIKFFDVCGIHFQIWSLLYKDISNSLLFRPKEKGQTRKRVITESKIYPLISRVPFPSNPFIFSSSPCKKYPLMPTLSF